MKRKLLIIYLFIILNAFLLTSCGEKEHKLYGGDTLYVSAYTARDNAEVVLPIITNWKFEKIEMKQIESNIVYDNCSFFCDSESTDSYNGYYLSFGKIVIRNLEEKEYNISKIIFTIDDQDFSYNPNTLCITKAESSGNAVITLASFNEVSPHVIGTIYYKERISKELLSCEHTMDFELSNLFLGETKIDSNGIYYLGEKNMKFDMDMPELDSESLVFYTFSIILNYSINGNDYTSFNSYNGHLINTYSNKTFKKYVKEVL